MFTIHPQTRIMADDILYTGLEEDPEVPTRDEVKLYIMSKMNVSQDAIDHAIEAVGLDKMKVEEYLSLR